MSQLQQLKIPCTYMRGGTSKAIFLLGKDLPPPGIKRDNMLMRMMGNPDPNELDGMGGAQLVTSKIAIIDPPSVPNADINYTFGQAEILKAHIDYKANCGNISSAVGPFAIYAGFIKPIAPLTEVKIYNTNSKKMLYASVPIINDEVQVQGVYNIAGVPGTGAEIFLDFRDTVGAETNKCLPTGNMIDEIQLENGKHVKVTICDVANVCVVIDAADLGISCTETKTQLDNNIALLNLVREIRGKAAKKIGFCDDWRKVDDVSPMLPFVIAVTAPTSPEEDLRVRLFLLSKCHPSLAGTSSVCLAACSAIENSVAHHKARINNIRSFILRIAHPLGLMPLTVSTKAVTGRSYPDYLKLGYGRTARRIMSGEIYIPNIDYS